MSRTSKSSESHIKARLKMEPYGGSRRSQNCVPIKIIISDLTPFDAAKIECARAKARFGVASSCAPTPRVST